MIWYCEQNGLDPSQVSSLISKSLKEKIQLEDSKFKYVKDTKMWTITNLIMYGGFDVYKTYLAVKLHFTSDTYDYYKYDGKVNAKLDTFTKRKDRYFFHKLSTTIWTR